MIASVNWLKKYTEIDCSIDELATLIGARLVEIEEVIDLGEKYKDVVVARVVEATSVPDSDHLNLCKIDDGGARKDVERDENGLIQVVCGAPNVRAGLLVAWLPPNSVVPETHETKEPFVLGARKLRGFMSNGMIASARELALWDEHEGILEIDLDAKPGDSFAELYELNDCLLDIENKSLTHRPDCFGLIGLAREISAIQGKEFVSPKWYLSIDPILGEKSADLQRPTANITDPSICERYQAIALAGINVKTESPILIKSYLSRSGMRPISAAVDITNYLMLVTGQPLHAFDYDKLCKVSSTGQADIVVRAAKNGEKMKLLDGRDIEMSDGDIVISAGETPVALAGAMGGFDTEIDSNTQNVMIESATFDLYRLRNTQFRHGIFSEAITRFTKGQPAELTAPVLASAVRMFVDQTDAKIASDIVDSRADSSNLSPIEIDQDAVNNLLGTNFDDSTIEQTLKNIGYEINRENQIAKVLAPWWRTDIHIAEDVIEDIGRINGFDNIEPILPKRDFVAVQPSKFEQFREELRRKLVRAGGNETLTYSFVPAELIKKVRDDPDNAYKIVNAISPDLQHYRQSVFPSLLDKAVMNLRVGYDEFMLFEFGKVHAKGLMDKNEPAVPAETHTLSVVLVNKNSTSDDEAAFYQLKKIAEFVIGRSDLAAQRIELDSNMEGSKAFEPKRAAHLIVPDETATKGYRNVAAIGELKYSVRKAFKLPDYAAVLDINLDALFELRNTGADYAPLNRYPSVDRDITIQVDSGLAYGDIERLVHKELEKSGLKLEISPVSIYQRDDKSKKNISFRFTLASSNKTLTGDEISGVIDAVATAVDSKYKAKVI